MGNFAQVQRTALNLERIIAVLHKPELNQGGRYSEERYCVVFDTGQEIYISPVEGSELIEHHLSLAAGTNASVSEAST